MKTLQYFFKYFIIMLLGYMLKYIGIRAVFDLPYYCLIGYNFVAIYFGIKKPLEKNKDVNYKEIRLPIIILSTLLNTILIYVSYWDVVSWIFLFISNTLILLFLKPNYEKSEVETKKI